MTTASDAPINTSLDYDGGNPTACCLGHIAAEARQNQYKEAFIAQMQTKDFPDILTQLEDSARCGRSHCVLYFDTTDAVAFIKRCEALRYLGFMVTAFRVRLNAEDTQALCVSWKNTMPEHLQ